MDSDKTDAEKCAGSEKSPKAADSTDPSLSRSDKPIEKESRDALLNFPWSSIFAPYPYTEFTESSSESKWMKDFDFSPSESSDEGEPGLQVFDWTQDPEFMKHLIVETGPSSPVVSSPEGEMPIDTKYIEAALSNHPSLLRPVKISGFDETNYSDDDPYDPPTIYPHHIGDYDRTICWEDYENPTSPVTSPHQNEDHVLTGAGLQNLGNTCFMNSVMQCLVHTVPFYEGIISNTHLLVCSCDQGKFCLQCCLRKLFQSVTSGRRFVTPEELVRNISYFSVSFRWGQQDDAHEFLLKLWTRLTECHDEKTAHNHDNFVRRVFGGRVVSKFTCCACGNDSPQPEDVLDLQLPVEMPDSLIMALKTHTKDNVHEYHCEKCLEKGAIHKIELDQVPPIVTLELKRFDSVSNKIKKHVPFPLLLDLLPYAVTRDGDLNYELYAIVVHEGESANVGHYYSFIRVSSNEWFRFDDAVVSPVNEEEVLKQQAYILFYAKQGTAWFSDAIRAQKSSKESTSLAASRPPLSAPEDSLQTPSPSELAQHDEGRGSEGDRDHIIQETVVSFFSECTSWQQDVSLGGGKQAGEGASLSETDENVSLGGEKEAGEDASLSEADQNVNMGGGKEAGEGASSSETDQNVSLATGKEAGEDANSSETDQNVSLGGGKEAGEGASLSETDQNVSLGGGKEAGQGAISSETDQNVSLGDGKEAGEGASSSETDQNVILSGGKEDGECASPTETGQNVSLGGGKEAGEGASLSETDQNVSLGGGKEAGERASSTETDQNVSSGGGKEAGEDASSSETDQKACLGGGKEETDQNVSLGCGKEAGEGASLSETDQNVSLSGGKEAGEDASSSETDQNVCLGGGKEAGEGASLSETDQNLSLGGGKEAGEGASLPETDQNVSLSGGKEAGEGATSSETDQNVSLGGARKVDEADEDASLIGVKKADEESDTTKSSREKLPD